MSGSEESSNQNSAMMQMLQTLTTQMATMAARMERLEQPGPPRRPDIPEASNRGLGHDFRDEEPQPARHAPVHPDVKINPPPFAGKLDPEEYLDWERRMELLFEYYQYDDPRRVALATAQFTDHALAWWDREVAARRRARMGAISSWTELTGLMRRRYIPPHFHRELQRRFRRLTQGSKTVAEYFDEFEHLRNRLEIDESEESLMAQFLDGLQEPIARKVERQPYHDLGELFHLAVQIEKSNQRKTSVSTRSRTTWSAGSKPYERPAPSTDPRFKGKAPSNPAPKAPTVAPKTTVSTSANQPQRSSEITCFKCKGRGHMSRECPNQRIMVMTASGEYESEDEQEEAAPAATSASDDDVEYAESGDLLMIRRVLSSRFEPDEIEQRETIFHSKCTISGKVCSLIIDGGSCTNAASKYMVEKLGLAVTKHPRPYRLRWLNNKTELYISDQVKVSFGIGRYQDQVICDVVPMSAGHLLLGRPWQFDRETTHNGRTNFYSFVHEKRRYNLAPMSPHDVREMQSRMAKDQHTRKENFLVNAADIRKAVRVDDTQVVMLLYKELLSASGAEDGLPEEVQRLL